MREAFGLLTSLPHRWDPARVGRGWLFTPLVGLTLGLSWFVGQQIAVRVGGPFVAAGTVLLLHVCLTGGRSLRGLSAVAEELTADPVPEERAGRPDAAGAATAIVVLVLVIMSAFITLLVVTPAALVMVPLIGRAVQVGLLGDQDLEVGPTPPGARRRIGVVLLVLAAVTLTPLVNLAVLPVRLNGPVEGVGFVVVGVVALVITFVVAAGWRSFLRARFGGLDANAWHSIGAIADLVALAAVVGQVG